MKPETKIRKFKLNVRSREDDKTTRNRRRAKVKFKTNQKHFHIE